MGCVLMKNILPEGPNTNALCRAWGRKVVITLIYSVPLYFLNGQNPGLSNRSDLFSTVVRKATGLLQRKSGLCYMSAIIMTIRSTENPKLLPHSAPTMLWMENRTQISSPPQRPGALGEFFSLQL